MLQRFKMLRRQNFRRHHNAALITVFHRLSQRQRADNRLTAAYIALQNAVHRLLILHIQRNLTPRLLLCRRQLKGQSLHYVFYQRAVCSMLDALSVIMALLAIVKQAALQQKQLLKNKALLSTSQCFPAFRKVNIFQRRIAVGQIALAHNLRRQAFRQILCCQSQGLTHPGTQILLRQVTAQSIHRDNTRRFALVLLQRLHINLADGLRSAPLPYAACNLQHCIRLQLLRLIALPAEKVQRSIACFVTHRHGRIAAAAGTVAVFHLINRRFENLLTVVYIQLLNLFELGIIEISTLTRVKFQQITHAENIKSSQFSCLFYTYTF